MNPEPSASNLKPEARNAVPPSRFALQEHATTPHHWDLFLERDGVLKTWSLPRDPTLHDGPLEALRHVDHRLAYLTKEGEVSGGRGSTKLRDSGAYAADWGETRIALRLEGKLLRGPWELAFQAPGPRALWIFRRALNAGAPGGV